MQSRPTPIQNTLLSYFAILAALPVQANTLPYGIDAHSGAAACEFHVDSFAVGDFKQGGVAFRALDAEVRTNQSAISLSGRTLLAAGAELLKRTFKADVGENGEPILSVSEDTQIVLSENLETGILKIRHSFARISSKIKTYDEVKAVTFFVDVREPEGQVTRLWHGSRSRMYTLDEIFTDGSVFDHSLGIGTLQYAAPTSIIYERREACGQ